MDIILSLRETFSRESFGKMDKITLSAEKRTTTGRKVKNLRRQGFLPANIYGKKIKSQSVQIKLDEFEKVFKEAGETSLIELISGKEKRSALIHNVQTDPVSDIPIHADFLQVDLKEKVTAEVPVELSGESTAEKQGLGTLVQYIDEIQVEALPADLPEKFEIDVTGLANLNDAVLVNDLAVDREKVEVKNAEEQIIVKIEPLHKEEEVVPPAAEEVAAEVPTTEVPTEEEQPQVSPQETQEKTQEA